MYDRNARTKLYNVLMGNPDANNAIGRSSGSIASSGNSDDNFFTKRWKSIDNAFGTTGAAIVGAVDIANENQNIENRNQKFKQSLENIFKNAGYNNADDYYNAKDAAEKEIFGKYGFDSDDYWNKHAELWNPAGTSKELKALEAQRQNVINNMSQEDADKIRSFDAIQDKLKGQSAANSEEATKAAKNWEDYRKNSNVGKRINQDRGKFLGSAINTLSTATDIAGLSNGPLSNAIQGGIEGVADELEQNGLENFDVQRAAQNALTGATTGAVTGALNKGISNSLAKNGGNLFKGNNFLTKGINDLGSSTAVGRGLSTIATGAGRGAISGAVGGATGAGLSAALNNQDILGSAIEGAKRGFGQGAVTGGIMAGANMAINNTPGVGNFMQKLNKVSDDWRNSGRTFNERLTNTLTSGDSVVGDWLMNKRQSNILGAAGNLGNRVQDVSYLSGLEPEELVNAYNRGDISENELANVWHEADKNTRAEIEKYIDSTIPDNQTLASQDLIDEMTSFNKEFNAADYAEPREGTKFSREQAGNALAMAEYNIKNGYFSDPAKTQQALDRINAISNKYGLDEQKSLYGDFIVRNNEYWDKSIKLGADDIAGQNTLDRKYADVRDGFDKYKQLKTAPTTAGDNTTLFAKKRFGGLDLNEAVNNSRIRAEAAGLDPDTVSELAYQDLQNRGINSDNLTTKQWAQEISNSFDNVIQQNATPTTAKGWLKKAGQRIVEDMNNKGAGLSVKDVNNDQYSDSVSAVSAWDRLAQQSGYRNYDEVIERFMEANPNVKINQNGMAGEILTWMDNNPGDYNPNTPTTTGGWLKKAGQRIIEDANNRGAGLSIKDVKSDMPEDINTMKVNRNDMVGYTDDNTEPITVEEALAKAETVKMPRNNSRFNYSKDVLGEETMGAKETTSNPQTKIFDELTGKKTDTASKLRNAAGLKLQQQYGTIDKPTAKATNAPETLQTIAKAGFTKPADVERMADAITGSNGEVSKLVSNLVKTAKPVDTFAGEDSGQTLDDYINFRISRNGLDGINEGKAVKSQIDAIMKSLPSRAEGSISFKDAPEDVFKLTQTLDAEAANYEGKSGMNYGTTTPDKLRAAKVIKDVSNLLKDRIYETADVEQALTPEVARNLKAYDPNNKEYADYVDNEIMKAKSVADLRKVQAPWVRAKKIIDNGYMNSVTYGGRNGGSGSPIPLTKRGLVGAALDLTVNSKPGLRAQAKVLNKAADIADKNTTTDTNMSDVSQSVLTPNTNVGTQNYNPSTQIYNAIGRTQGAINADQAKTANYLADAVQEAEVVPNTTDTISQANTSVYNTMYGSPASQNTQVAQTGYFPATGDYWTDILASAMSSAIDDNDSTAFATLYEMYQDALSNSQKSSTKDYSNPTNWNSSDRTKLLSAQNAMDQIDQLESAYNNATGGQGSNAIQGWLRSRAADISGGNWDPSASNYNSLAESVGMGIVKNLINLGVTEADAKRYLQYLPALTDTKEQASQKLDTLRNIYQSQINNLYATYEV